MVTLYHMLTIFISKWVCAQVVVKVTEVFNKDLLGVGMRNLV